MIYEGQDIACIANVANERYGWKPPVEDKFFATDSWTNSDNIVLLQTAISDQIGNKDTVLTIPGYTEFFEKLGAEDIQVYDMSVNRLREDSSKTRHWADVSNPLIFDDLLREAKPTALYLSNIPDHIVDKATSNGVARTINGCVPLKKVFVTQLLNSGGFDELTDELVRLGWKINEYKGKGQTEKVATLQRD